MSYDFSGKTALITGAAGSLGRAVTETFAANGASLILVDRSQERLDALAAGLVGRTVLTVAADVGDPDSVEALFERAEAHFGRIDMLAHTVGGYEFGEPVHRGDLGVYDRMMALNARPVYVLAGRAARHMLERGGGKIVIVLARAALKGTANHAAYTASKAAAQRVMEALAAEVRDHGINVNGVLPSVIDTPPNRQSMPNADFSKWVTPQDVANAIAFLCSDEARALHGVSLEVYNRA
ncbi:MAG: SDR family NAD(P)-dependent oxidoreductase [Candidatus Flexifilum sp.]